MEVKTEKVVKWIQNPFFKYRISVKSRISYISKELIKYCKQLEDHGIIDLQNFARENEGAFTKLAEDQKEEK